MRINRSRTWRFSWIVLLIGVIFLSYLMLTPPAYYDLVKSTSLADNVAAGKTPIKQKGTSFVITAIMDCEFLTEGVSNYVQNRTAQDYGRLLRTIFNSIAVMLTSFGVLIHYRRCMIRNSNQHISLLATSRGGHAPPLI